MNEKFFLGSVPFIVDAVVAILLLINYFTDGAVVGIFGDAESMVATFTMLFTVVFNVVVLFLPDRPVLTMRLPRPE